MIDEKAVSSIEELIYEVRKDHASWKTETFPWFRGEPNNTDKPLLPKLYRPAEDKRDHKENRLLQNFRAKAPIYGQMRTPVRGDEDLWLFLAQHYGLPTRLLDWTEGLCIALYFALLEEEPVVWMLDPIKLCRISTKDEIPENCPLTLTWVDPANNILRKNIDAAWKLGQGVIKFPVAVKPTYIDVRMSVQKSCFTVHGSEKKGLSHLVKEDKKEFNNLLNKYIIVKQRVNQMKKDLMFMGISQATLFPDLSGLSKELESIF
jgi:hypothetical protein